VWVVEDLSSLYDAKEQATMPSIDIAMERSLRRSAVDLLIASLRPALESREVITDAQHKITDVKTAFSSWDNCMKASFCK
jgi:hypothetical protein